MTQVRKLAYGEKSEPAYDVRLAMQEASRCLLCIDAPCSQDCPVGTNPSKFIRSIRFRNFKGAAKTIRENNILGASCGKICPQERLCEKGCSRCGIDKPIQIGRLQSFAMEQEKIFGMKVLEKAPACGKKVACIGAGPSSLGAAAELAKRGVAVTIFDENEQAGGLLRYGITPSRLDDATIDQDIAAIKDLGVVFEQNHRVSPEEVAELAKKFDAIYVGVGLSTSKVLKFVKGWDKPGVDTALNFLKNARVKNGKIGDLGKVVIIGGGDVAMDCASTAKQLGAKSVNVVFIETMEEMPASKKELDYITDLGVPVLPFFKPLEIKGEGKVEAISFASMDDESSVTFKADTVIFAVGQAPTEGFADLKQEGNIFLGGDMVVSRGRTVVESVQSGKEAAFAIADFLKI